MTKQHSKSNDIRGLLSKHPTIQRVVFGSGATSAKLFSQHNKEWLRTHQGFVLAQNDATKKCFGKLVKRTKPAHARIKRGTIELIIVPSVSPAHAVPYSKKRDEWFELVYHPMLPPDAPDIKLGR
jgi:hypothetical protein